MLTGNFLSSQGVSTQVLSASECLTTVFGMGTGGTIQASSPDLLLRVFSQNYTEEEMLNILVVSQALDLLVSVRYMHFCTSTPDLSTLSSTRGLTRLLCEKPHLKAGFTLRCFQRLSFPNVATQLYCWRNNWYTIGSSTPVLSY